jgi:hypothetical protein
MRTVDTAVDAIIECMSPIYAAFADLDFNQTVAKIDQMVESTNINLYHEIDKYIQLALPKLYRRNKIWYKEKEAYTVLLNSNDVFDQGIEILNCQLHVFCRTFFHQSIRNNNSYLGYLNKEMPIKTLANIFLASNVSASKYSLQANLLMIGIFASLYEKINNINKIYSMYRGKIKIQNDKTEVLNCDQYQIYLEKYGEEYAEKFKKVLVDIVSSGALNETIRLIDKRILEYANNKVYQKSRNMKLQQSHEETITIITKQQYNKKIQDSSKQKVNEIVGREKEIMPQNIIKYPINMQQEKEQDSNNNKEENIKKDLDKEKKNDSNKDSQEHNVEQPVDSEGKKEIFEINEPKKEYQIERQILLDANSSVVGEQKEKKVNSVRKASVVGAYNSDDLQTKYKPLNDKSCCINSTEEENSCMTSTKRKKRIKEQRDRKIDKQSMQKGDSNRKEEKNFIIVSTKDNKRQQHDIDSGGTKIIRNKTNRIETKTRYKKNRFRKKINELQIKIQPDLDINTKINKFLEKNPLNKNKSKLIRDIEKLYIRDTID